MISLPNKPGLARRLAYGEYVRKNICTTNLTVTGTQISLRHAHFTPRFIDVPTQDVDFIVPDLNYEQLVELEDVRLGLSIKDINANSYIYAKGTKLVLNISICIICQEFFKSNSEIIREMNCGHPYHIECIDRWFEENVSCPICKHVFN